MTGTTKKARIQGLTDWNEIPKDKEKIPSDIQLLIAGIVDGIESYCIGFFSAKTKVFIEIPTMECLDEVTDLTHYHVMYDTKGNTITAYSDNE